MGGAVSQTSMGDDAELSRASTALADLVRQRLVQIASDVLNGLPVDQVPAPLRPIAKFAPAKRAQLGAAALSAALDTDSDFRERVANAVTDALPQLVEALRAGESTLASDPIDTAVVAYLTRPPGWAELVAQVSAVLERERSERDAAADEIGRVRAELSDTRSQLKALRAKAAEAAAAAGVGAAEEATRLRNTLRVRTGELKAARAEVESALAEVAAARAELAGATATKDAELERLRARVTELETALDGARRDVRGARESDDARLRVLLDALTGAAAGIRRELDLPAGVLRPADAVTGHEGVNAGMAVRDAADLDRLLAVPEVHLIIDGYNVTKTGYPELTLAEQRSRLVAAMGSLRSRSGAEITVTFDGSTRLPTQPPAPRGVRVLFSAPDETADDLIRRLVAAEPAGRTLVVVTSDKAVVADVRRAGAQTAASQILLDGLARG
jgi:predicted RNA-binding protein with PIN domain